MLGRKKTDHIYDANLPAVYPPHPGDPLDYAPPKVRTANAHPEAAVREIATFAGLPTKELDDIVAAAEAEIAALKTDAQTVRDVYVRYTDRITADVQRLRAGVQLSMAMMAQLREQCVALDAPGGTPLAPGGEDEHGAVEAVAAAISLPPMPKRNNSTPKVKDE